MHRLGLGKGDGTGNGNLPSSAQDFLSQIRSAPKTVPEQGSFLKSGLVQNTQGFLFSCPGMDNDRHIRVPSQLQLSLKSLSLPIMRGVIPKVIQTDFTHGFDPLVPEHGRVYLIQTQIIDLGRLMGVHTQKKKDLRKLGKEGLVLRICLGAEKNIAYILDTAFGGSIQDLADIVLQFGHVQMGMGVHSVLRKGQIFRRLTRMRSHKSNFSGFVSIKKSLNSGSRCDRQQTKAGLKAGFCLLSQKQEGFLLLVYLYFTGPLLLGLGQMQLEESVLQIGLDIVGIYSI